MKESSLNISLQKCHSKQNEPSSPKGEETRWGLLSSPLGASNRGLPRLNSSLSQELILDDGYQRDLLKWI